MYRIARRRARRFDSPGNRAQLITVRARVLLIRGDTCGIVFSRVYRREIYAQRPDVRAAVCGTKKRGR